jgi:hypothetical protein
MISRLRKTNSARVFERDRGRWLLALGATTLFVATACHRSPVNATPSVESWPPEEHCWWAAYRTTMPPDSVAIRFGRALESIGFSGSRVGSLADTAWAQAGPSMLAGQRAGTYAARVVAIRMGDSTRFRPFVASDTLDGGKTIPMCGEIMRRTALHASVPREEERDDSTPRWRRRPR